MKYNAKIIAVLAAAGMTVAAPAMAHPGPATHPAKKDHPAHSHKCRAHNVAYDESGTVDPTSTFAVGSDGSQSGTLVVDVTGTNHWAKADKGQTVSYTFSAPGPKVHFEGTSGFSAGERVKLIGKLAAVAKKCTAPGTAPAPVFRLIIVKPAASSSSTTPSQTTPSAS